MCVSVFFVVYIVVGRVCVFVCCFIVGELSMQYFVHHSWRVHSYRARRMSCVDVRQPHSFDVNASIRTASSIQ